MERDFTLIKDILKDTVTKLKETENSKNEITGIPTGFTDIDYEIKGLNNGDLIVIGARPTMGKTSFALNIATNVALKENIPVAIFSLEVSKEQCINRILSSQAMVNNKKLNDEKLDDEEWQRLLEAQKQLAEAEIYIDDTVGISIEQIREKCRELKQEKNIGLVVIDYLQLIKSYKNYTSREEEISAVSFSLKKLAQELNIPVIVLSPLAKTTEERFYLADDPRPILADLSCSGSLVKDADVVMLLYRDDYYNADSEKKDIGEVIIAKNKYGNPNNTVVELLVLKSYFKFVNLERNFNEENIQIEPYSLEQELKNIKKYTNLLDNIDINEIKDLIKNDWKKEIYILFNNGDLYINGILEDTNIDRIFVIDDWVCKHIYSINRDNIIMPIIEENDWDDLDFFLYNNNKPYKKLITDCAGIVGLTKENKVIFVNYFEMVGVTADNLIDVENIFVKDDEIYIRKKENEMPLFVIPKK